MSTITSLSSSMIFTQVDSVHINEHFSSHQSVTWGLSGRIDHVGNHGRDWKVAKQGEEELGKLNEEVYQTLWIQEWILEE